MTIKIKWEAEITKLRKDMHTIQKENVKLQEKLRGVAKESKKGAAAQDALGRTTKRVYREMETPAERYNRKMQQANRLLKAGKINQEQYGRAARRAQEQAGAARRQSEAGAGRWIGRLAGVAAGYVSIQTAIRAAIGQMEDLDEQRRKSRELTRTTGDVQRETLFMLGAVPQKTREAFVERMERLTAETKPAGGLQTTYLTMTKALSAGGGDVERAVKATRQAARVAPQSAEAMSVVAEALIHLGKATKDSDARANMGFLVGVAQQAAVTNMRDIAQYGTRGILGVAGYGGTAGEAGAIWAAITQAAPDPHGRIASTAAIGLASQLDKYFVGKREELAAVAKVREGDKLSRPEREAVERFRKAEEAGGYVRVEAPKMTPLEMIRFMRTHPEARQEFMGGASFEKVTTVAIQQLLGVKGRGDVGYQFLQQGLPKMVKGKEAVDLFEGMIGGIDKLFDQKVANIERQQDAMLEHLRISTPAGRRLATEAPFTKEKMSEALQAAGVGGFQRWVIGADYTIRRLVGVSPQEAYKTGIETALGETGGALTKPQMWTDEGQAKVLREGTERLIQMTERAAATAEERTGVIRKAEGDQGAENLRERYLDMLRRVAPDAYEQHTGAPAPIRQQQPSRYPGSPSVLPGGPDRVGAPAQAVDEGVGRAVGTLTREIVRQRQVAEEQLGATREQTDLIRQGQGNQGAVQEPGAVVPVGPAGFPGTPGGPPVIVQPREEPAEVGFSAN